MRRSILIFFLIIISIISTSFSEEQNWNKGWQYRLTVEVTLSKDTVPVEKVALINFFGKAGKEDGSDIRVFDKVGNEVPVWVVSVLKDDRYQIVFPVEKELYYVYYGNPQATSPQYKWMPQRGLILEVYKRVGIYVEDWGRVKDIIKQSKERGLLGRSFWEKVWDGTNPFESEKDTIRIYEGYFYLFSPDKLVFATSSAGPSYIFIDDNLIAYWEGWHRAEPYVRPGRTGKVFLEKGLHKFTYYHIGRPSQEISVAAIKDKNEQFIVIQPNFFLPISKASITKLESYKNSITGGFEWENTNYLKKEEWELITFKFKDKSFPPQDIKKRSWSFGDGQKAEGKEVTHTYLKEGIYPVSLEVKDKNGNTNKVTLNVFVRQDYKQTRIMSLSTKKYIQEFEMFNLNKFNADLLFNLAGIYKSYGMNSEALKVYLVLDKKTLNENEKRRVLIESASLACKTGDYNYAEQVYIKLLSKKAEPDIQLKLASLYLEKREFEKAEPEFLKIIETETCSQEVKRRASIGIGDIWRAKGDYDKALNIYREALISENIGIKSGSFGQTVISTLRAKNFNSAYEKLVQWAQEIPVAKLEGNWSVLLARAYILNKEYKKAVDELEVLIRVVGERDNIYIPVALYLAGESYENLGNKEKATLYYQIVIEKHPSSAIVSQAYKKLEGLR